MRREPSSGVDRRRQDDRFQGLKRRVTHLARLDGEVVRLKEGLFLVQAHEVKSPRAIVTHLRSHGVLDRATFERNVKLDTPLVEVDAHAIAAAHRDLRALGQRPALELAHEHRRALARYGTIDEAWLRSKRKRVDAIAGLLGTKGELDGARWFDRVVELVGVVQGEREASRLAEAGARVEARAGKRRRAARERVTALVASLASGGAPEDVELACLAERLDAARELPGRARRRRVLDILRRAVAWPNAPAELVEALGAVDGGFPQRVEEAGHAMAAALPVVRDPRMREQTLELLATLGLVFAIGEHGLSLPDEDDTTASLANIGELLELAPSGLPLAKAIALSKLPMKRATRLKVARWITEGLELELVAEAAEKKQIEELAQVPDVRAARAYATWSTRLSAHYEAQGVAFSLSPELFANLPRNEDLAILAMCLMEHVDPKTEGKADEAARKTAADPIAVLDATLALFQRLPAKARGILGNLRGSGAGEGRKLLPEFAAWFDNDALLDRCVHIARLAGETPLSSAVREDFEHAERARGERAHLEKLATRSAPQQGRLDALLRAERTLAGSPLGRTRRRVAERIERLLPIAYRRELDATFREILREAWSINVPALTPAWRDAVRFWLVVDDNRALLGRLLEEASKTPGRSVKHAFAKNDAWIEQARGRLDIDAWLAPRSRTLTTEARFTHVRGAAPLELPCAGSKRDRFIITLEEDPLEVLRMGIPFGTCLALGDGCNAASTVLNAIEANKRVLYVRNGAGRVVARKLLAISTDARLIGYNLYCSVRGDDERAIRAAVLEMCRELSRATGAPLSSTGEPAQLYEGFWYDDGTVPFDEDVDVATYCKTLGLPPPPKWYEDLGKEAQGWRACETGDVLSAVGILSAYDGGPANRSLGSWVVDRLGLRTAEKKATTDPSVFVALSRSLADSGEYGMIRALDVASRMPEYITHHRVAPLLARFPPSPKIAVALVDLGLRAMKRRERPTDHGLAHLTLHQLPPMFEDVAGAFDLLDSIEPVWAYVKRALPACERCVAWAIDRAANVVEAIFERAPDPDVVVATLMSRHRSVPAQRAALRVAARHVLGEGERALVRFAVLRPELAASPDGVAAFVRQARVDRVTDALVRRAPVRFRARAPDASNVDGAVFDALRDLLLGCANLEALVPDLSDPGDLDTWSPGHWELAWRRRRRDDALRNALFERAAIAPGVVTRAMEQLALLGDLRRVGALDHVTAPRRRGAAGEPFKSELRHDSPRACRRTAASLAEQVKAEQRGRVHPEVVASPQADAGYVELARRALMDDATDEASRDIARDIVLAGPKPVVDWQRLLAHAARSDDSHTVKRILEEKVGRSELPSRIVVDLWQMHGARKTLARAIASGHSSDWSARVWAAEREATARGLSVEGLLEGVALALVAAQDHDDAVEVETLDQLRSVVSAVAAEAAPADVAATYNALEDALSVAAFVRAIRRQPRAAELREAAKKLDFTSDRGKALEAWLESSRSDLPNNGSSDAGGSLQKEVVCSIERM